MAEKPQKSHNELSDIELRPDGWERFRHAVHAAAKSGPKHRPSKGEPDKSVVEEPRKR